MSEELTNSKSSDADELVHQQEFGSHFRIAREAAGLSLIDVSEALKLPEEIIRALESSQVEQLPAPTFTRGYIRNYSRFLKVSENDILEIYNQYIPEAEKPLTARSSLNQQSHNGEAKVRLVTYALVFLVLAGVVMWLLQPSSNIDEAGSGVADEYSIEPKNVFHKTPDIQLKEVVELPEIATTESNEGMEVDTQVEESSSDVIKSTNKTTLAAAEKKIIKKVTNENIEEFVAKSGDDILVIGTVSESWIEIQDANTPRLIFELIKKGSVYRVKGQAPFKVFLGNAPSVSLQLNGKAVDIMSFLRSGNIAHVHIYKNGEVVGVSRNERPQNKILNDEPAEEVE
jgi:cytoskeleton protein RodZ